MWIQVFKRKIEIAILQFARPNNIINISLHIFQRKLPILQDQNPNLSLARIQAEERGSHWLKDTVSIKPLHPKVADSLNELDKR